MGCGRAPPTTSCRPLRGRLRTSTTDSRPHKTANPAGQAWAGSAKLTWDQVEALRSQPGLGPDDFRALAQQWDMHPATLHRAYHGKSWPQPKAKRLPEEFKRCAVCSLIFGRALASGRRRIPKHWSQKATCGRRCATILQWRRGCYAKRGGRL